MASIESFTTTLKSGHSVVIRTGSESDAAAMREAVIAYIQDGEGMLWAPGEFSPTVEKELSWIQGMLRHPDELLLVAEHEGRIVGNIDFHVGTRRKIAHTGEFGMSVLPEWRGRGLGSVLLGAMIHWARSNPRLERIDLSVLGDNARAIDLYHKHGFVEEGRRARRIKQVDGSYVDDVLMGLLLRSS